MTILCLEKQRGNKTFPWQMGDVSTFCSWEKCRGTFQAPGLKQLLSSTRRQHWQIHHYTLSSHDHLERIIVLLHVKSAQSMCS